MYGELKPRNLSSTVFQESETPSHFSKSQNRLSKLHAEKSSYSLLGKSRLSQTQQVLSYFDEPSFVKEFSAEEIVKVIETCLSSSYFGTSDWKQKVLANAERIIAQAGHDSELRAAVQLRKRVLLRIFPDESWGGDVCGTNVIEQAFTRCDPRSNAYFGELLLSNAQDMIDRADLDQALRELGRFRPLDEANPSALEYNVLDSITFFQGKIDRFKGNFSEARKKLEEFLCQRPRNGIICKAMVHLISVYSELGKPKEAIDIAEIEVKACRDAGLLQHSRGRNSRLALAEAHLMDTLLIIRSLSNSIIWTTSTIAALSKDTQSSKAAKQLYQDLLISYQVMEKLGKVAKVKCFSVSAGLAILSQLEDSPQVALSKWDAAANAAKRCGWEPGFVESIIALSTSELQFRIGNCEEANRLEVRAKDLLQRMGRQHYFTGLGSIWFDLVDNQGRLSSVRRWSDRNETASEATNRCLRSRHDSHHVPSHNHHQHPPFENLTQDETSSAGFQDKVLTYSRQTKRRRLSSKHEC